MLEEIVKAFRQIVRGFGQTVRAFGQNVRALKKTVSYPLVLRRITDYHLNTVRFPKEESHISWGPGSACKESHVR